MELQLIALGLVIISGLLLSGSLLVQKRLLTLLATAGVLAEVQWLLLVLVANLISHWWGQPTTILVGAILLIIVSAFIARRHWQSPYRQPGSGLRDLQVLIVLVVVLGAAWLIASRNGLQYNDWVWHGFYNGDTATFISLVQKSLITNKLVTVNPFAGNGPLEYPTLLHAGFAHLWQAMGIGVDWLEFLPLLVYVQISFTIPLFFLLFDLILGSRPTNSWPWLGVRHGWLVWFGQIFLVLAVLGLSWDTYVYPQSHFFLTASYLLLAGLLLRATHTKKQSQVVLISTAAVITVILVLSNAVTGTAALVLMLVFSFVRMLEKQRSMLERELHLALLVIWPVFFILAAPGAPAFGLVPHFSYTAAADLLQQTPFILGLLVFVILLVAEETWLALAIAALTTLGFITFTFSNRDIVVDNASRFFYQAILIGFPWLLLLAIRGFYWWRREMWLTYRTLAQIVAGSVAGLAILGYVLLPIGASVASAHDNLMFKDEHIIRPAERVALWWIQDHTAPNSVFVASPQPPWAIPILTGRTLLRSSYWLSPDDALLARITAAFNGDKAAQADVMKQGDYLILSADERKAWEPVSFAKPFDSNGYVIYDLHQPVK